MARLKHFIFFILAGVFVFALLEGAFSHTSVEEELTSETKLVEGFRDFDAASKSKDFDGNDLDSFLTAITHPFIYFSFFPKVDSDQVGTDLGLPCPKLFLLFHQLVFYH